MARKNQETVSAESETVSTFQGKYVSDLVHVLITSALSGQNLVLLSAPGWGKTKIARELSHQIAGAGAVFTRLEGSTPPEKVKGMIDPAAALDNPPRLVNVVDGTPYDPRATIVVADEIFRPNDVVFDIMLDVLDRQDVSPEDAPVVWGTSNFVVKSERVEAILDRIALWHWVQPSALNMHAFTRSVLRRARGASLSVPSNGLPIPTFEDIKRVRSYIPANEETCVAVSDVIDAVVEECSRGGYQLNPRRFTQWIEVLYRMSAFLYGSPDFERVHHLAAYSLKWSNPSVSMKEWQQWVEIVGGVIDPIAAAIDTLYSDALSELKRISGATDLSKSDRALRLGTVIANAQRSMRGLGNDPRIEAAINDLIMKFTAISQGEEAF